MEQLQMGTTIKTEDETLATSTVYSASEIDLNQLKQEPGSVQSVKSEPAMLVKKEIEENGEDDSEQQCAQGASAPAGAGSLYEANSTSQGDWINVKPELDEMDIGPTVLQHMDIHYALNKSNNVGGCSKAMRCGRVKEDREDMLRAPTMYGASANVMEQSQMGTTIKTDEETLATSTEYSASEIDLNQLKQEHELVQSVKSEPAMLVKKEIVEYSSEDDSEQQFAQGPSAPASPGSLYEANSTSQGDWINVKSELDEMDIGPTVLQHMDIHYALNKSNNVGGCSKAMWCSRVKEDREDKLRDNKATLHNYYQTTTGVDYDDAHMKSHQAQQEDLKKHCTTTSKGCKCDKPQCRKRHLLSVQNCLHQRNSRKAVTTRDTVTSLSDQNADTRKTHYHCNAKFEQSGYLTKKIIVQKDEKPFRCKLCVSRFARNSDLTKHLGVHTGEKPYQCKMCDARFIQNGNLTAHMRIHTGEKPYQCKICSARFSQLATLTRHVRDHTGEKPYHCKICDARFKLNEYLTAHMKIHNGEKPYQCKMCDARFAQNGNLTAHMKIHMGEKPYQCKICDAAFKRNGNLTGHLKIHTGEKPYHCKICDGRFTKNGYLTAHMRIHTGEKPYQCKMCDARFALNGNLTAHMKIHTGEKPYQCKICDARFKRNDSLTAHMTIYTGEKPYQCKMCGTRFARNGDLTRHIRIHTGKKRY